MMKIRHQTSRNLHVLIESEEEIKKNTNGSSDGSNTAPPEAAIHLRTNDILDFIFDPLISLYACIR